MNYIKEYFMNDIKLKEDRRNIGKEKYGSDIGNATVMKKKITPNKEKCDACGQLITTDYAYYPSNKKEVNCDTPKCAMDLFFGGE